MWIYNVCKVREPEGNGYEILEKYTDRTLAYTRMFAIMDSDKSGHYFVERFSDEKNRNNPYLHGKSSSEWIKKKG